jgi:ATP-binding cassette subfamily B protein
MSIYRRVLAYYRPYLPHTLLGLLLSLGGIGLNLLKPWPFKIIVDDVLPNFGKAGAGMYTIPPFFTRVFSAPGPNLGASGAVAVLCVSLVILQLLWAGLNWVTTYIFVKVGLEALLKLRTDLYSYMQSLSL